MCFLFQGRLSGTGNVAIKAYGWFLCIRDDCVLSGLILMKTCVSFVSLMSRPVLLVILKCVVRTNICKTMLNMVCAFRFAVVFSFQRLPFLGWFARAGKDGKTERRCSGGKKLMHTLVTLSRVHVWMDSEERQDSFSNWKGTFDVVSLDV